MEQRAAAWRRWRLCGQRRAARPFLACVRMLLAGVTQAVGRGVRDVSCLPAAESCGRAAGRRGREHPTGRLSVAGPPLGEAPIGT
eukprot:471841-Prymnesium_polylepis.1